jgi:hypothetical protein
MNTAINHGREIAEAVNRDGYQLTPEQLEAQELMREARMLRQRANASLFGVEHPELEGADL